MKILNLRKWYAQRHPVVFRPLQSGKLEGLKVLNIPHVQVRPRQ